MIIEVLLFVISIYLIAGVVFAIAFVIKGAQAIDEGAKGASIGFRIIIFPGCAVFWPILLKKWRRQIKSQN